MTQPRRRTRTTTAPAAPARPTRCCCRTGPTLVGTFRDQDLVRLERRHWRMRDQCEQPAEQVDIIAWMGGRA